MTEKTRILIVEDEAIVRKGIIQTVDWSAISCEVVGEASDGKEAVIKIKELKPDIIITDICMKEMDGIELLKTLKKEGLETKAIILSGYNDFEYAKRAMELGVRYYLLKPVENERLIEAVISIRNESEEKKKITDVKVVTKQQIALRKLLEGEDAVRVFNDIDLVVPKERFVVANIKIANGYEEKGGESLKYTTDLLESVDYFLGIDIHFNISILVGENNIVVIIFEKDGRIDEVNLLKKIRKHFVLKTGRTLNIGISRVGDDISQVHELYEQSCIALQNKLSFGKNNFSYYCDDRQREGRFVPIFSDEDKETLIEAAMTNDTSTAYKIMQTFFDNIRDYSVVDIAGLKNSIIELAVIILRRKVKNSEEMQIVFGRKIQPAIEIVQLGTIVEIEKWFFDFLDKVLFHTSFVDEYQYSPMLREIISYIMQNYSNKLSAGILAKQFFVSEGHLMRVFKKETNRTIVEFIMEYRIYIAKNLLKTKKYKIYEVAILVGYDDTKYFSKIFKRITGQTANSFASGK